VDQLDGARVLLVDDSPVVRKNLGRQLDVAGAEVTAVGSASAALSALAANTFDVLVCDLRLSGTDGYALIQSVRAGDGPNANIAAVAITGHADDESRRKALDAGFDEFLPKLVSALLVPTVALCRAKRDGTQLS
jgi:two-component system CheB/CheR fusion protein